MTQEGRAYIRGHIDGMVQFLRATHPSLTHGEIYDAIAQDLERRCRAVIDLQKQRQRGATEQEKSGLMSPGEP